MSKFRIALAIAAIIVIVSTLRTDVNNHRMLITHMAGLAVIYLLMKLSEPPKPLFSEGFARLLWILSDEGRSQVQMTLCFRPVEDDENEEEGKEGHLPR